MEKATITTWMKQEGDSVNKGDVLCIIETDKVNFEMEAPEAGVACEGAGRGGERSSRGRGYCRDCPGKERAFDLEEVIREAKGGVCQRRGGAGCARKARRERANRWRCDDLTAEGKGEEMMKDIPPRQKAGRRERGGSRRHDRDRSRREYYEGGCFEGL